MPQSFASLHCHIVFSTKNRRPQITRELQPRIFEYVGGIARNHSSVLIAAGGLPDHVHFLISLGRTIAIADLVRVMKSNSSAWIHSDLKMPNFEWQNGYGVFAVSFSQLDAVKHYLSTCQFHTTLEFS